VKLKVRLTTLQTLKKSRKVINVMQIETEDWQGTVQYLSSSIGMGYYYYQVVQYPLKKRDEWRKIDEKMMARFDLVNRYKRARRKQKGWANFLLVRHEDRLYILMTDGEKPPQVDLEGETFKDARKVPLRFKVGNVLDLVISASQGKVEVHMPRDVFQDRKAFIVELAKAGESALKKVRSDLYLLGGIPGYAGINRQRKQLVSLAVKHLRQNQCRVTVASMPTFYTGRKTRKVFKTEDD